MTYNPLTVSGVAECAWQRNREHSLAECDIFLDNYGTGIEIALLVRTLLDRLSKLVSQGITNQTECYSGTLEEGRKINPWTCVCPMLAPPDSTRLVSTPWENQVKLLLISRPAAVPLGLTSDCEKKGDRTGISTGIILNGKCAAHHLHRGRDLNDKESE